MEALTHLAPLSDLFVFHGGRCARLMGLSVHMCVICGGGGIYEAVIGPHEWNADFEKMPLEWGILENHSEG